jgi:uncharacterized membrane protein YhiD involved in acid resistance
LTGTEYLVGQVIVGLITAVASVIIAIAYAFVLPQIRNMPSPRQQSAWLERTVATRTAEKDRVIREINHRVGNQLQIMSSLIRIERRRTTSEETLATLARLDSELEGMNERHHNHSSVDYLAPDVGEDPFPQITSRDKAK